jgi:hypothetical protein
MKKLFIPTIVILATLLSGCGIQKYLKEADDLYNRPCYRGEDKEMPEEVASFYESNYSDTSDNDKAVMVYERLKKQGWDVDIIEQRVKVVRKIVTWNGRRIWPCSYHEAYSWSEWSANMKQRSQSLKGLDKHTPVDQAEKSVE